MKTYEYFDKKIGGDMWGLVNEYLEDDNKQLKKNVIFGLKEYFYFNQYDEERYPHFRACDRDYEHNEYGEKIYYYMFYE
jgi:hypothetical protein